jgi:hypothetical protein
MAESDANEKIAEQNAPTPGQVYTAVFTLRQTDLDGEVIPTLEFLPLVDPTQQEAPAIYEYMSNVVLQFLRTVNAIDEDLQIVDQDEWDRVQLTLTADNSKKAN